ncbi:MAG: HTH domain-containing protein [Candidatus Woesearchaeota archaeon]
MVNIEIVADLRQKMKKDNEFVREVIGGRRVARAERTIVLTPEAFSKIFSPQRIKLLLEMKQSRRNIYQLAKQLSRSYEAVYRDVRMLEGFGIIKVKSEASKKIPCLENIQIPVFAQA